MGETEQLINGILELPPQIILVFFLNFVGVAMKLVLLKIWKDGTWIIPIVLVPLGGFLFTQHVADGTIVFNSYRPGLMTFEIGCIIGVASIGVYEWFVRKWTDPILKKIMGIKDDSAQTIPDSASGK